MALNAARPTTSDLVSDLATLGQEERDAINLLEASIVSGAIYTDLVVPPGVTTLIVGTHVSSGLVEVVRISSLAAITIQDISGGVNGQIKIFHFATANVSFADNDTYIDLNQLPTGGLFTGGIGDILELMRVNDVWVERNRSLKL